MTVRHYRVPPLFTYAGVALVYVTVDVAAPLTLSSISRRHGWDGARPGVLNVFGMLPLVAGAVLIVWAGAGHTAAWRERDWRVLKLDPDHLLTPDYLITDGLYRFSRNPLYVGDLAMWAGWAAFLGSVPVAAGLAALLVGLQAGVRIEERGLARQFGEEWLRYASSTPRFLGLRRQT